MSKGSTTTDCEPTDREQRWLAEKGDPKYIFAIPSAILPKPSLCDEITATKSVTKLLLCGQFVRGQFVAVSWLGSMPKGFIWIAFNGLDCAASELLWSVDLLSYRFQIFIICGYFIDCSGRRYTCEPTINYRQCGDRGKVSFLWWHWLHHLGSTITLVTLLHPSIRRFTLIICAWWLRTSSKFRGQKFEEIRWNMGSLKTYKLMRILPSTK